MQNLIRRVFRRRRKNSSGKSSYAPANSDPASARTDSATTVQTTLLINVADDDQTLSTFGINITRTNDKVELPRLQKIMYPFWKRNKMVEVTFSLSKSGKKRKRVYILPKCHYFFSYGFKIINISIKAFVL